MYQVQQFICIFTAFFVIADSKTIWPKVVFCPQDMTIEATTSSLRVHWQQPIFAGSTCSQSALRITSNYKSGDIFFVPTHYQVHYIAIDEFFNTATCDFAVRLKRKGCPKPKAPLNGITVCSGQNGNNMFCIIMCKQGYDVSPYVYIPAEICNNLKWQSLIPGSQRDCLYQTSKGHLSPYFYYTGNIQDPSVQAKAKQNFIVATKLFGFCNDASASCNTNDIRIYSSR